SPGTCEALLSPRVEPARGAAGYTKPLACGGCARLPTGAKDERKERYRQAKDDEVRRNGQQGVGAPRSTCEAGELTRGTRWREGGVGLRTVGEERCRTYQGPKP